MLVCLPAEMMTLKMLQIIASKNYVDVSSGKGKKKNVTDKIMNNIFWLMKTYKEN
jgi:hypothetical protein